MPGLPCNPEREMVIMGFLPPTKRHAVLIAIGILLVAVLAACGRKGPVRPRLATFPAAPSDLQVAQQGEDFLISWMIPELNQDGTPVEDLRGFHVYRMIYPAADGCPTCRDPEELVAAIALSRPAPAMRVGKRLYWRDAAVAPGTGHAYLVVPVTVGDHEGPGAGAHRVWQESPPAPSALQAEAGERQVSLAWTPPSALPDGQVLLGYNLYRRPASGTYPPVALNGEPLSDPRLTDFVGEAGREAFYRVTTLVRSGDRQLESVPCAEVAATPQGKR